jgi:preprotein translocase subunit SecD
MIIAAGTVAGCAALSESPPARAVRPPPKVTLRFHIAQDKPVRGWAPMSDDRGHPLWVGPQADLTEADVVDAQAFRGERQSMLQLRLSGMGAARLADLTRENVGARLAIFLNDKLVSAPRILHEIGGGQAMISGDFTYEDAMQICLALQRRSPDANGAPGVKARTAGGTNGAERE